MFRSRHPQLIAGALSLFAITSLLSANELKKQQAQVKGLLIIQLGDGETAGTAAQMNATVTRKKHKKSGFELGFNQKVGKMMQGSSDEVEKFIRVRHSKKLPKNARIELAFADKFTPKDGPSAAVACAIMSDALFSGRDIDPGFAVTGDMTATGEVRPVGGVRSKISGAIRKKCTLIGVPDANKTTLSDAYILEGLKPLYDIQVFSLKTFEEAEAIAYENRTKEVQEAIDEFGMVQKAMRNREGYVFNAKVQEKLRAIVKTCPNHLSARLLLLHGLKRGPQRLSLEGSIAGINKRGTKLSSMLDDQSWQEAGGNDDVLAKLRNDLSKIRPKLDKRTVDYADAYRELAEFFKKYRGRKILTPDVSRDFKASIQKLTIERKKLYNNPEVREELMMD